MAVPFRVRLPNTGGPPYMDGSGRIQDRYSENYANRKVWTSSKHKRVQITSICSSAYHPGTVQHKPWGISKGRAIWWFFRQARKSEVQIWRPAFLGRRVLCGHSRTEQEADTGVRPKSIGGGQERRPNQHQGIHWPVYGRQEYQGIRMAPSGSSLSRYFLWIF